MTESERLYTSHFFLFFAVTVFFMCGFSLQFHFGEYVGYLGGSASELGWVLGLGMLGSLCVRPFVGTFLDRFGAKPGLLVGAVLATVATACYSLTTSLGLLGVLRIATMMAMATYFTAIAVLSAAIAPPRRRAESLGTLGMGGFVGMMLGPTLGDLIFSLGTTEFWVYRVFFLASAGSFLLAMVLVTLLRAPSPEDVREQSVAASARAVVAYWPGLILLVGLVFAMAQTFPFYFLERMAAALGFEEIKVFFLTYCPTAIALRLVFRRLPERFGRRRTCVLGMVLYGAGMLVLRGAESQVGLIVPAIILGAGHCFVFPSMVDLCAERLPAGYRGTGTALILGAGDVGSLGGFILWGQLVNAFGYGRTLTVVCGVLWGACVVYGWSQRCVLFRRSPAGASETQVRAACGTASREDPSVLQTSDAPGQ